MLFNSFLLVYVVFGAIKNDIVGKFLKRLNIFFVFADQKIDKKIF